MIGGDYGGDGVCDAMWRVEYGMVTPANCGQRGCRQRGNLQISYSTGTPSLQVETKNACKRVDLWSPPPPHDAACA